jgi:hypothetical protein
MSSKINVPLKPAERDALIALAMREYRHPRDQAALIVRRELERLRLLPPEPDTAAQAKPEARHDQG